MKACFEYMTVEMKLIMISFAIDFIIKKSMLNLMALKVTSVKFLEIQPVQAMEIKST